MNEPAIATQARARRVGNATVDEVAVTLAEEVPVAMVYNGLSHAVMIGTPADLEDFALGFSLSEGILQSRGELLDIEIEQAKDGIAAMMTITQRRAAELGERRRTLAGRTGCGLCGVDSLDQVTRPLKPLADGLRVEAGAIRRALGELRKWQTLNALTGAVHGAAWVTPDGAIALLREDVGRHNALDKLLGAMARNTTDPAVGFALITSRCSFEMVQKAATCGIAMLVAISAPTALALRVAEAVGVTIVALARADSISVYTHGQRVPASQPSSQP